MRRRLAPLIAALTSLAPPGAAAGAQVVDVAVDAGLASVAYDQYARSTAFVVAPALLLSAPRASLEARSALSLFEGGSRSVQAGGTGRVASATRRGFAVELMADGGVTAYNAVSPIGYGRADLLARYTRDDAWGVWAGPAIGAVGQRDGRRFSGLTAGVWGGGARTTYGCRVTPVQVGGLAFADTELWGGWGRGALELSASAGVRAGDLGAGTRAWLNGGAALWLGRRYAVVAGAGAYPADLVQGVPGGRFGTLALRVRTRPRPSAVVAAPDVLARAVARSRLRADADADPRRGAGAATARDFAARPVGGGWYRLGLHAPDARTVELMGDFTNWEPVPLQRAASGRWELALPLGVGSHRFNVRLDGGPWTVPAGVATVGDDYGGVAGILGIM